MPISEDRLQMLMPSQMKESAKDRARHLGLSLGEYVRRLIEADLRGAVPGDAGVRFPFGDSPVATGRTHGSVDHDKID